MKNMFNSDHVLQEGTHVTGDYKFTGTLVVRGGFQGNFIADKANLKIAESGSVQTDELTMEVIEVRGSLIATTINAREIIVHPTGKICGHLNVEQMKIMSGAAFEGKMSVKVREQAAPAPGSARSARSRLDTMSDNATLAVAE